MSNKHSMAERLKQARVGAGFPMAAKAARAAGVKPVTLRAHESGQNGYSVEDAARYAAIYGVSVEWLLTGDGSDKASLTDLTALTVRAARSEAALIHARNVLRKLLADLDALP